MKFLKLLLLSFIFLSTTSFIQTDVLPTTTFYRSSVVYDTQTHVPWTMSGAGYWRSSNGYSIYNDFDFLITRSVRPINGYYYYDIWFFSQSYYWDGYTQYWSSTNISEIDVYVDGYHTVSDYTTLGITFNDVAHNATSLRFYTKNSNAKIYLKWNYMKAK